MGKARQGETGGVERVSSLRGESGQAGEGPPGGEPTRHWPPEPVAKAGITGSDGAVIGAFKLKTGDKDRSPAGVHTPAPEGQDARRRDVLERHDMVRCDGEDRGTAIRPS